MSVSFLNITFRRQAFLCVAWLSLYGGVFVGSVRASAPEETTAETASLSTKTITNFNEYWDAAGREISRPIKMTLLIDYYDGGWNHLWAQCGGEPGYMPCATAMPFRSRDRILIEGRVVPRKGLSADTAKITILEHNVPENVIDANGPGQLGDYMRLRARVVTFDAILDSQVVKPTDPQHLLVTLVAGGYRVHLYYWDENGAHLLNYKQGDRLRLKGLYIQKLEPQNANLEVDLWVYDLNEITYLGDTETEPRFNSPIVPIERLQPLFQEDVSRAHIVGEVRSFIPGRSVTLRDATGEAKVETLQSLALKTGDWIEAVGVPFTGSADWLLRRALIRHAPATIVAERKAIAAHPCATLRLADEVLALTPTAAAQNLPVDLTGVITWSNPQADFCYLQDASGAIRVQLPSKAGKDYHIDAQLHVWGVTLPGVFAPQIRVTKFEFITSAVPPEPKQLTLEQAMTGVEEGRRVEISGHVQRITSDQTWTHLVLSTQTGTFSVLLPREDTLSNVAGSIISVQGVCQAIANERRQLTSIEILARSSDDIRVEHAAMVDPFAEPLRGLGTLRQYGVNAAGNYWSRVKGLVTQYNPGHSIIIQDGNEGLALRSEQTEPLSPGDMIEATGLPGLENGRAILREALYRKIGHVAEPTSIELPAGSEATENFDELLVRTTGTLLSTSLDAENLTLSIQSEQTVFAAILPRAIANSAPPNWRNGSSLQLQGVYEVIRDQKHDPSSFRILLRTLNDVQVLNTPSWWTPARAFAVTGSLAGLIIIGLSWVAALRRRVTRQTDQIRSQIFNEANLAAHNQAIVANASDCIFTTDLQGNFTSFNPAGERLLGYSPGEVSTMTLRDLINPADLAARPEILSALNENKQAAARFELRLITKAGRSIWTEISVCLIQTDKKATGVLGVARDIGERKAVELALQRAHDAAKANTEAKSAFLANMSHEIRTPMNGVIGMSNLMLETNLTDEQRDYAKTIRNSAEALLTVLNDILDFSKIEAGKLHFETINFDLDLCMEETLEVLAARASEKKLELALYIPPDLSRKLRGDPGRLRQVFLNLVGNAIKFTSAGSVVLNVACEHDTATSVALRFEIRDTGVGISENDLSALFRPFSQADASTTRRFGGTGLGLAISKQIVELMQGEIGVSSVEGKGSCFWFTARFYKQTNEATPTVVVDQSRLKNVRLVCVDDQEVTRQIIRSYVDHWGMRGETVATQSELINLLALAEKIDDPIQVLLIDEEMPEKSGLALINEIKNDPRFSSPPIILLKSVDRHMSAEEINRSDIIATVAKPIRQDELLRAIYKAVRRDPANLAIDITKTNDRATGVIVNENKLDVIPSSLRVLIAEDNPVNQRVVLMQLKKLGFTADVVTNGREALDSLQHQTYDLVLMDCHMPEMDGYQASRAIRQDPRFAQLKIIAMTANAMQGDREKCLAAGMDDYLPKPVRVQELSAVLARITTNTSSTVV